MYWGEHFSKGHVTWTSRPAPRLTLSDVQRRGPRTVMRVHLGVAMNYGCTRPGRTLLAVAAFSSSTAAAGGTGRIQIVFDGEGPKARGLVLLPLAPLPREERRAGRGTRGAGRRGETILEQGGAGGCRRAQAPWPVPVQPGARAEPAFSPSPVSGWPSCPLHPPLVFLPLCGRPEGRVCKSQKEYSEVCVFPNWNPSSRRPEARLVTDVK